MPEALDRDRAAAAYAAEVRGFQTFFGGVLILLALLHLFILLPYLQLRTTAPRLAAETGEATQDVTSFEEGQRAVGKSVEALSQLKAALDAAPRGLYGAIATLVARGRAAQPADPYKATIHVAGDPRAGGPAEEETITVEEAIKREIGRRSESLAIAFDATVEPLRGLGRPPEEIGDVLRTSQEGLGRNLLVLNEVLREAFAADPNFWTRLNGQPTFAAASQRADNWTRGTLEALHGLEARLATAATNLNSGRQAAAGRVSMLESRRRELEDRLAAFTARLSWMPLGLETWSRLYPLVAGALALTVLVRVRRILLLRRALAGMDLDLIAPSWIVGTPTAPGRWWSLVLLALPPAAAVHAALTVMRDPSLFSSVLGEPDQAQLVGFGVLYSAFTAACVWHFVLAAAGMLTRPRARTGRAA